MVLFRFIAIKNVKPGVDDDGYSVFIYYICITNKEIMKKNVLISLIFLFFSTIFAFAGQRGKASFYSHKLKGRHTSYGGKYQPDSLTCAHRSLPFGTLLRVFNPINNKEVIVKVTDRGPHRRGFLIDLSYSAAKQLDMVRQGIASVIITEIDSIPGWKLDIEPVIAMNNNGSLTK